MKANWSALRPLTNVSTDKLRDIASECNSQIFSDEVKLDASKRIPGYTDRILFASHDDASPVDCDTRSLCDQDRTEVLYFSSAENIVLSDHKPVHAIIRFPRANHSSPSPHLAPRLPPPPTPHPSRPPPISPILLLIHKMVGMLADRLAGWTWCLLVVLGAGNLKIGLSITLSVLLFGLWWSNIIRV